jgi:hypothetical protein
MTKGIEGGGAEFIKTVSDLTSRGLIAGEAEQINKGDYTQAARYKTRSQMQGVRG